jgi:hypothetical protein
VTFDPSGDFETQGYLRNLAREKDPEIVRHLEHASFMTGLDAALERLAKIDGFPIPICSKRTEFSSKPSIPGLGKTGIGRLPTLPGEVRFFARLPNAVDLY